MKMKVRGGLPWCAVLVETIVIALWGAGASAQSPIGGPRNRSNAIRPAAAPIQTPNAALVVVRASSPRALDAAALDRAVRSALGQRGPYVLLDPELQRDRLAALGLHSSLTCGADACLVELAELLGVRTVLVAELEETSRGPVAALRQVDVRVGGSRRFEETSRRLSGPAAIELAANRLVDQLLGLRPASDGGRAALPSFLEAPAPETPVPPPAMPTGVEVPPAVRGEEGGAPLSPASPGLPEPAEMETSRRRLPWVLATAAAVGFVAAELLRQDTTSSGAAPPGDTLPGPPPPPR